MKRAIFIIACNYRGNRAVRELNVGRDMVGLGGFFEHVAGFDIVEIVQDVPRDVVLAALERVVGQLNAGDLLVIQFGGHGVQRTEHLLVLPPGVAESAGEACGFLSVADLQYRTEGRGLSRAMILDCCRNDDANSAPITTAATEYRGRVRLEVARNVSVSDRTEVVGEKGTFAIFCACSEREVAPELGVTGKGLFSTALLNVLKRASSECRRVCVDDSLRMEVEAEMHRLGAEYGFKVNARPWKSGNDTPELLPPGVRVNPDATATGLAPETKLGRLRRELAETVAKGNTVAAAIVGRSILALSPQDPHALGAMSGLLEYWSESAKAAAHEAGNPSYVGRCHAEIAYAQAEAGDSVAALKTAEAMEDRFQKVNAFLRIAEAQAKAWGKSASGKSLDAAIHVATQILDTDAPYHVVRVAAKLGELGRAEATAKNMTEQTYKDMACVLIAEAQVKAGQLSKAWSTWESASGPKRGRVLSAMIRACAEAGKLAEAETMTGRYNRFGAWQGQLQIAGALARAGNLSGAAEIVSRVGSEYPDKKGEAYAALAYGQLLAADIEGAKSSMTKVADPKGRAYILVRISEAQFKAGDARAAQSSLKAATAAMNMVAEPIEKDELRREIVRALAGCGDVTTAKRLTLATPDAWEHSIDLEGIARRQAERGDAAGAKVTASEISDPGVRACAYGHFVEALVRAGDIAAADEFCRDLRNSTERVRAYTGALRGLALEAN